MSKAKPRGLRVERERKPAFLPSLSVAHQTVALVTGQIGREELVSVELPTLVENWRLPVGGFWLNAFGGVLSDHWLLDGLFHKNHPYLLVSASGAEVWRGLQSRGVERVSVWRDRLVSWTSGEGLVLTHPFGTADAVQYPLPLGFMCGDLWVANSAYADGDFANPDESIGFDLEKRHSSWSRQIEWRVVEGVLGPMDWTDSLFAARSDKTVAMFSKGDGRELWRKRLWTRSRLRSTGDRMIAWVWKFGDSEETMSRTDTDHLMCFDSHNGELIYDRSLARLGKDFDGACEVNVPAVGKDHIVFSSKRGLLAAFRMSDGELAWTYKYESELYDPTIVGNSIAVASSDGNLLMFDEVLPVL